MTAERPSDRSPGAAQTRPALAGDHLDVAVVGAGLSGLACARILTDRGRRVRVFDKGRGAGGRMSTRRAGERRFDHGAQYFTVRDPRFATWVDSWRADGLVAEWRGRIAVLGDGPMRSAGEGSERLVGVPGMSAVCGHLAADLEVRFGTRVAALDRRGGGWRLAADDGVDLGRYDALVVSAPAPQTAALLGRAAPGLAALAAGVEMTPCWAVMASFADALPVAIDGAFVHDSSLSWVARNGSKPSRPAGEHWVLHASPGWSAAHFELGRREASGRLLEAFGEALGERLPEPIHLDAHLWRFALPEALAEPCLFDAELQLAACGDWCGGSRVEGAFLSGCAAAGRLLAPEVSVEADGP